MLCVPRAQGVFEVFGDGSRLPNDTLCQLLSYLGPQLDPGVTADWVRELRGQLPAGGHTAVHDVGAVPLLAAKMGA